jgi:cell division protein FtsB
VILVFLIIDHAIEVESKDLNRNLLSEVDLLDEDISDGRKNLVRLRNTRSDIDLQMVDAQGRATLITEDIDIFEALIKDLQRDGFTERADIEALRAEILSLEEEVKKLRSAAEEDSGSSARSFIGEGNRQYLTGLNLGGRNIAILLDVSSSMLAEKLVNIIRLRNMSEDIQLRAEKWTRSLSIVDWLTAQLPVSSKYQVITFNTEANPALPETAGKWLEVADEVQLEEISAELRKLIPSGGTSLENAFLALQDLSPATDNIFLITDGLPTQGATPPRGNTVSGRDRQKLYRKAVKLLPRGVPVNIILVPMEGDPMAASEFWQLAQVSQGSFLSPSEDWP